MFSPLYMLNVSSQNWTIFLCDSYNTQENVSLLSWVNLEKVIAGNATQSNWYRCHQWLFQCCLETYLFKCTPYTYIMQILSSKMTQLDGWDAACFNKARAGNDSYEDSDELSKRRQRHGRCRRGCPTESSSVESSEPDEIEAVRDWLWCSSDSLSKDGARGTVSFGGSLIK